MPAAVGAYNPYYGEPRTKSSSASQVAFKSVVREMGKEALRGAITFGAAGARGGLGSGGPAGAVGGAVFGATMGGMYGATKGLVKGLVKGYVFGGGR